MGAIFTWNLWIGFLLECLYTPVKWSERISDFDNLMCDAWTNSYWQRKVQAFVLKWSSIDFPRNFTKIRITFIVCLQRILQSCHSCVERVLRLGGEEGSEPPDPWTGTLGRGHVCPAGGRVQQQKVHLPDRMSDPAEQRVDGSSLSGQWNASSKN